MAQSRRRFLKQAAGLAGAAALPPIAPAQTAAGRPATTAPPIEQDPAGDVETLTTDRCGADCMVDVVKSLGIEFACAYPGSSFRALQESFINYGGNRAP